MNHDVFGQEYALRILTCSGTPAPTVTSPAKEGFRLRIGFAGKLTARKGVDELLRACALLPRDTAWSLTVVGDGPMMAVLRALADQLGIEARHISRFRQYQRDAEAPRELRRGGRAVAVRPGVLVTIEAMAAGAIMVVSDTTAVWGRGNLVTDGITGLVYRSGDPVALARQCAVSLMSRVW